MGRARSPSVVRARARRSPIGPPAALLLVLALGLAAGWPSAASADAGPPAPRSIAALERSLRAGATTCRAVTAAALARIRAAERGPRALGAVVEVNPDALAIARRLDARRRAGRRLGALHCLPLLVKDNYETADRLQTTAGSIVMRGFRASRDAFVVRRLRAHGAVVLGKTNMDEWAHGTAGYSSNGGQTRNGRRATRGPSGSSGGSAAAVARRLALVATGSDTGGSIQGPASWNGVVGLRPTVGLVSRAGIIPFASVSDVPGPLTGSVADLARVLGVLTGVDPADPATRASRGRFHRDYTPFLRAGSLRGARIGVLPGALGLPFSGDSAAVDAAFSRALRRLRGAGATVIRLPAVRVPGVSLDGIGSLTASQFHAELDEWFRGPGRAAPVDSLAEVVQRSSEPGIRERVRILPALEQALAAPPPRGPAYRAAIADLRRARAALLAIMRRERLDAVAYPTMTCPAAPLAGVVDPTWSCRDEGRPIPQPLPWGAAPGALPTILSPVTGLPALTVPAGRLPGNQRLGINLLGPAWSEGRLISFGYAFERAQARRAPVPLTGSRG